MVLNHLIEKLEKKRRRNELRTAFYDGKNAIRNVGGIIPPQYTKLALVLGWAAKGVDGLARRCNIDEFYWEDGELDSLGMDELEESNMLLSELSQGRTDSLIHATSFLVTTQGDPSLDEPDVLVHARDGLCATGDFNVRTRRLDNLLSVTSRDRNTISGFVLYLPDLTISASKSGTKWDVSRSEHSWGVPAEPLVYRPRSSRRMGRSRISRPVMGYQEAAMRALVRLEAHMDIYAIPKMLLLGASDRAFKNADGSMKTSWQVVLGRVFAIPDDEDATTPRAQFQQERAESPEPHLKDLNALAKLMARELDLPDSDFALTDMSNPTSAEAYTASRENLVAEAEGAMGEWSPAIRRTVLRALAMQNGESEIPPSWMSIKPKWRSPMYVSKAAAADAGQKQLAAVPWLAETRVGLELLGLSKTQIDEAMADRRRAQGRSVVERVMNANGA